MEPDSRMYKKYYGRLLRKAWDMTKAPAGISGFEGLIFGVVLTFLTFVILSYWGQIEIVSDELYFAFATLIAIVSLVVISFIVNCFRAAVALDDEWNALYSEALLKLENKALWQEKLDELWTLRSEGISLRNIRKFAGSEFDDWKASIDDWRERTEEVAFELDPNLKHWIHHLDTIVDNPVGSAIFIGEIRLPGNTGPKEQEHSRYVRMASTVLDRLARYLLKEFSDNRRLDE